MVTRDPGTVLITGPTGGLGRQATLAMAGRPEPVRPDLILIGRSGERLTQVADEARAAGATVHEIGCDQLISRRWRAVDTTNAGLTD